MSPGILPPPGFAISASGPRTLVAERGEIETLRREGFADPARWEAWLAEGNERGGRGAAARRELASGRRVWLKRLRRGGLLGPLWCHRFRGHRRLVDNLGLPLEARRRGVATPRPVALLLLEGPRGLFQAWLAMEEIPRARDLGRRFRCGSPPGPAELTAAMRAVRGMHDAGIEHRDLNVGNLLVREAQGGAPEAWVIDLDGASLHDRPLALPLRRRSLRRLERSFHKLRHKNRDTAWDGSPWWFALYAPNEPELRRGLARGGTLAGMTLVLHRLGWGSDD